MNRPQAADSSRTIRPFDFRSEISAIDCWENDNHGSIFFRPSRPPPD